ncbi:hypothetical protein KCTCHS21_43020 [Cohnella abietis]|uniref:Fungal lipase-like domain-containing protein n=1 Tax=Cohnella abietis TaxID=2507935 RepID=A0A3T1DA04_9BACL|nr:hypothetical protein KCTCHS21_43020 [Cohnella abietis]
MLKAIASKRPSSKKQTLLFIGHSGGGIAGLHAAQLLQDSGSERYIVMIGSPKCRIPVQLDTSVLTINAADIRRGGRGKSPDRVSRLGTHGGWRAGKLGLPTWHRQKYAPIDNRNVPIIGGHADYFRDSEPYVDVTGRSNLDLTLETIQTWLTRLK